jgi:hypothetical protein
MPCKSTSGAAAPDVNGESFLKVPINTLWKVSGKAGKQFDGEKVWP